MIYPERVSVLCYSSDSSSKASIHSSLHDMAGLTPSNCDKGAPVVAWAQA